MHRAFVIAACALLSGAAVSAQTAGREPAPGQPEPGGTTLIDSGNPATASGLLRLWRVYSTQGGRVMLKVYRPESDRLVLVGSSPLESVPPATVATFTCSIPVSRSDLVGCFCPDSTCLDRFADGVVLTAPGDVGTSALDEFTSTVGGPAVWAGTTLAVDIPSTADTELVLPVAARNPGLLGTLWTTALELFNTATTENTVALFFNQSNRDNTAPAASAQITIPPRGTYVFDDLLGDAFQVDDTTGAVDLVALAPIIAHARIANHGGAEGTYGQFVPAFPARWAVGDDHSPGVNPLSDIVYLFELREDEDWRTNLGIVNTSGLGLTVQLQAFVDGTEVGEALLVTLQPYSHTQLNQVLEDLSVAPGTSGVRVNVEAVPGSSARFFAYASRVDNLTGDAVFIPGSREAALP